MKSEKPKVTVLLATFNRPDTVREAIQSVINQSMSDWELLVMNDGGVDVGDIIDTFNDPRIRYFHDPVNRKLPHRLNFGLQRARGKYIAYLGDDDLFYPNHLHVLSTALDENPDYGVVYSDLYAVQFIKDEVSGRRFPLHKFIQVSRDYNRDFMFYFNHTLHVSIMHRKDLALSVGGYDESITVLIDWNMTRKLSFFTDFKYIPVLTGEYYMPITGSDRISNLEREDSEKFKHNQRKIKADLPPEPWPKVDRIAVVFPVARWGDDMVSTLVALIDALCYPVRYIIVNNDPGVTDATCRSMLGKIGRLKNLSIHTPKQSLDELGAYRYGVKKAAAETVFLATKNVDTQVEIRLITARRYMQKNGCRAVKWPVAREQQGPFDVLIEKKLFLRSTDSRKRRMTAEANILPPGVPESMECDVLSKLAHECHRRGDHRKAYYFINEAEKLGKGAASQQFLIDMVSRICFDLEEYDIAEEKCRNLIARGYGADNWIRLGSILQKKGKLEEAIAAFRSGIKGIGFEEKDLENPVFPICVDKDFGTFSALLGIGECMLERGDLADAARMFRLASKIRTNSHRPSLGFGRLFLKTDDLDKAEQALTAAAAISGKDPETLCQLGRLFKRKKQFSAAFDVFLQVMGLGSASAQGVADFYEIGCHLERWDDMKSVFEMRVQNHPDNIQARTLLAAVCCRTGDKDRDKTLAVNAPALFPAEPTSCLSTDTRSGRLSPVSFCQDKILNDDARPSEPSLG